MVVSWLEVNHSFGDASSSFYLRYLTLVPASLIIYARPLFNVINVSACSTNTDNFLSLQSPQHLHPKAEDSYRADPIPFLARGCGPVISFANVFSLWMDPALRCWWVRNSGFFHLLTMTGRKWKKTIYWPALSSWLQLIGLVLQVVELVDCIDGLLVIRFPRLVYDVSHRSISISIS